MNAAGKHGFLKTEPERAPTCEDIIFVGGLECFWRKIPSHRGLKFYLHMMLPLQFFYDVSEHSSE
jgi:hypothetical protein